MSPFAQAARERKTTTFAAFLWAALDDEHRQDVRLPERIATRSIEWWDEWTAKAGVRPLSEESRALVVEKIAVLVNAERRGAPTPCDRCDGSGEREQPTCHHSSPCPCAGRLVACECLSGLLACEGCGDRLALVATPDGPACVPCARRSYPVLASAVSRVVAAAAQPVRQTAGAR